MIDKIRRTFALTEDGAKGIIKASLGSCLMYMAYMLPIILLMIFVQDALGDDLKGALVYVGIMAAIIAVMYVFINISYNTTYNETYKEAANLRISIATTLKGLPLSYFSRHDVSDLSQTVMQDVADVSSMTRTLVRLVRSGPPGSGCPRASTGVGGSWSGGLRGVGRCASVMTGAVGSPGSRTRGTGSEPCAMTRPAS